MYILSNGEGTIKVGDRIKNDRTIREFIYFWLFDLNMLPKEDSKASVIKALKKFNNPNNKHSKIKINLGFLTTKFEPYEILLISLIKDNFVLEENKKFIKILLNNYIQINYKN